jgi:hypothetical protein
MGSIQTFLEQDHARLDALLARAVADPAQIDETAYAEFRAGLLRHIAMEEKVLLADAKSRRGGDPLSAAAQLRLDHAAIAAMLAARPDAELVADLRALLVQHNHIEEGDGGVYAQCERHAGADVDALLRRLHDVPPARPAPYSPRARIAAEIRRAIDAAQRARSSSEVRHVAKALPRRLGGEVT